MKIVSRFRWSFDAESWKLEGGTRKKTLIKSAYFLKRFREFRVFL
jgi:hypothetical protein